MILFVNTSNNQKIELRLYKNKRLWQKIESQGLFKHSEKLLSEIDKLLKKGKCKLNNLRGILVVKGPGSFSSLRIGVATANTLAFTLGVPVRGILKSGHGQEFEERVLKSVEKLKQGTVGESFVAPEYGKAPNITKPS